MSVIDTIANDAFTPYRGTDEMIQQFPIRNGAVYFAYDTLTIFLLHRRNSIYQMLTNTP